MAGLSSPILLSLLLLLLPFCCFFVGTQAAVCGRQGGSCNNKLYFIWSLIDAEGYAYPNDFRYSCTGTGGDPCKFPQYTVSLGYYKEIDQYNWLSWYPYMYGFYLEDNVSGFPQMVCGIIEDGWRYGKEGDRVAVARSTSSYWPQRGDHYDQYVKEDGGCLGGWCPLNIRLQWRGFRDQRFNGYYIATFPMKVMLGSGSGFEPIYKHSSFNLYLYQGGTGKDIYKLGLLSSDEGLWGSKNHAVIETRGSYVAMGYRDTKMKFCVSSKSVEFLEEITYGSRIPDGKKTSVYKLASEGFASITEMEKQCSIVYRPTENTMFGTGNVPFVVKVVVGIQRCVGTLISPLHILTLGTCFMGNELLKIAIEQRQSNCAGYSRGWRNCQRWFYLIDRDIPEVKVITMPSTVKERTTDLPADWIEFHPLFQGNEFDVAIVGMDRIYQRTTILSPICLPQWSRLDIENLPLVDRLYRSGKWEKYQLLYSLKAMRKDERFSKVWTDVNGPEKFVECKGPTESWKRKCDRRNPPPQIIGDKPLQGKLFEDMSDTMKKDVDTGFQVKKYFCEYFYDILEKEEKNHYLTTAERQIRQLQQNYLECFAITTFEFVDEEQSDIRCYERRMRCIKYVGWCRAGMEWGFCNTLNRLPDTPDSKHPLLEVLTFVYPKNDCRGVVASETRICTGHVTRSPTEYVLQVDLELLSKKTDVGKRGDDYVLTEVSTAMVPVFTVVEYVNSIHRPLVRGPDTAGRIRSLTSAIQGACHGAGQEYDKDIGAPTYFRYPVRKIGNGQDQFPGNAYPVLYSLQRRTGRRCNFHSYTDTEVLIAMDDIMEWMDVVISEVDGMNQSYPYNEYHVTLNLAQLTITTTTRTTKLSATTTDFSYWANKYFFKSTLEKTLKAYPWFKYDVPATALSTKPPLMWLDNYPSLADDYLDLNASVVKMPSSVTIGMMMLLNYVL